MNLYSIFKFLNYIYKNLRLFLLIYLILLVFSIIIHKYCFEYHFYVQIKHKCNCNRPDILIYKYNLNDEYYFVQYTSKLKYKISNYEFEQLNFTCDLYNVLRRGRTQNILGYSLYGKNDFYYKKLIHLTNEVLKFYPNWLMRVYYDNSINKSVICQMECHSNDNVDFCNVEKINYKLKSEHKFSLEKSSILNLTYLHAMKWRWLPIGDSFVDIFMSRDTDSYILKREVDAVNQWLFNSSTVAHLMRGFLTHHIS
jgi:hypothetical protein